MIFTAGDRDTTLMDSREYQGLAVPGDRAFGAFCGVHSLWSFTLVLWITTDRIATHSAIVTSTSKSLFADEDQRRAAGAEALD